MAKNQQATKRNGLRFGRPLADALQALKQFSNQSPAAGSLPDVTNYIVIDGKPHHFDLEKLEKWFKSAQKMDDLPDTEFVRQVGELLQYGFHTDTRFLQLVQNEPSADDECMSTQMSQPAPAVWPWNGVTCGLGVVLGGKGSGKTSYVLRSRADVLIRWGEPPESIDSDPRVLHARSFNDALAWMYIFAAMGARVALDSMRKMVYGMRGAAAAGGMSARFFNELTEMSTVLNALKGFALVTINPLVSDSSLDAIYDQCSGCATAVIFMANDQVARYEYRGVTSRVFGSGDDVQAASPGSKTERRGGDASALRQPAITSHDEEIFLAQAACASADDYDETETRVGTSIHFDL